MRTESDGQGARFTVRSTVEDDWPLVRQTRIENATDNPISYGATLATTLGMTEDDWRMRARRGTAIDAMSVAAVHDDTGRWIRMMSAQEQDGPILTGVWVTPEFRGRVHGVADALFAEVLAWVPGRGDRLTLWVDEGPAGLPARRFYARHGFTPTGRRRAIGFAPGDSIEMAMPVPGGWEPSGIDR
ncbi:GNAT family N-acetyltransferase [Curtobacterium sp. VKM Ac-2922]|uniref:GNAT family N-acetyltransferase n=1 Tax=Curtobacterium sp. VKM Ac-2922 TaxID=2929475 RepID=UPI001FB27AE8|nr:GNAT family N-acetyltransferase [Curtobacterium sp. VKM Ac-2922]MCJ1715429.1 GNAT family N-acetyltransferase [Curtobacterium sp. VKM Ac-2922]